MLSLLWLTDSTDMLLIGDLRSAFPTRKEPKQNVAIVRKLLRRWAPELWDSSVMCLSSKVFINQVNKF